LIALYLINNQQQHQQQHQQQLQQQQITLAASCLNGNQIDAKGADTANGNVVDSTAIEDEAVAIKAIPDPNADIDENDNATEMSSATLSAGAAEAAEAVEVAANLDINNINENGIITLDMSKIIDISGLPTYEGALKLESSGYV